MMEHPRSRAFLGSVFLVAFGLPFSGLGGQEQAALKLGEVITLVRDRNPRLRAARARVGVTRAREPGAGLLPDPIFSVGVMNLALPELSASMPASMAPTVQAVQQFPVAGKRSLREELARQSTKIDLSASEEVWWEVRTEAARAFYRIYQVDRQIQVLERTLGLLRDFETVALSLYAAGTGRQADVLRANVEVARMEAEVERMKAMRVAAAARLNALMVQPTEARVPAPELGPLPATIPGRSTLSDWAMESRPLLERLKVELDRAGTQRDLADKEIWPDFTVGLQYGLGRMAGDYKSMGGASVGFTIPLYAGRRQDMAKEEADAAKGVARAQLDQSLTLLGAHIGETMANLDQARILILLYREDILPQARAAVESALSSYRVGSVDFMTLIDAQMAVNRFEGEFYGLLASYGTSIATLEKTIGRDLPVTDELIVEEE